MKLQQHGHCSGCATLTYPGRSVVGMAQRRRRFHCCAFGADPYAPLERAIQVINQVLAMGEMQWKGSGGGGSSGGGSPPLAERWVQFGAVSSAHVSVHERLAHIAISVSSEGSRQMPQAATTASLLREYLALPVEEYSLLDPKWIQRDADADSNSFRFCVPLQDVIGVDLQPELSITAHPEPGRGRLTLVGNRAALGSADFDSAFKLNVAAVVSGRQRRRLPRIPRPDHLPGRPVFRLRRWAARARGRTWPAEPAVAEPEQDAAATAAVSLQDTPGSGGDDGAAGLDSALSGLLAIGAVVGIDDFDPGSGAPFPAEKIYISRDEGESEEEEHEDVEGESGGAGSLSCAHFSAASSKGETSTAAAAEAAGAAADPLPSQPASASQLHCRVNVTMAMRVPGPLRVVPNPLLGYAGGLILKAVLNATLPNFLDLLSADFKRWAEGGGQREAGEAAGELFSVARNDA